MDNRVVSIEVLLGLAENKLHTVKNNFRGIVISYAIFLRGKSVLVE